MKIIKNQKRKEKQIKAGEEVRNKMSTMVDLHKDFVGSHLRSQIKTLEDVLTTMETEDSVNGGYLDENLKRIEKNLRQLRRLSKN